MLFTQGTAALYPAKSGQKTDRSGAGRTWPDLSKKGRMPDLPEPEPKSGTSVNYIVLQQKETSFIDV